jgi:uncharacterized membrane protein (DUF4010 family)
MSVPENTSSALWYISHWAFVPILIRLGLALAIGLFIGLEREHSGKNGVRTFALSALLGCLGSLMGTLFSAFALGFIAIMTVWLNWREMVLHKQLAMTTSTALAIVGFAGVLCGQGHIFTPVVVGVLTAALLAWKRPISGFVSGMSDTELRSAILLAVLTFVIFPVLPFQPVDPWGLIEPQSNWASVIVIAAIGFANYILMKLYGPRGMEITAFLGGLVNSRKVVVELSGRLQQVGPELSPCVYRGIMLAMGAMVLRNGVIVLVLASQAVRQVTIPLVLMLLVSLVLWGRCPSNPSSGEPPTLALESPFQLFAALKFGLVFLGLNVIGALAQRNFGSSSFYFVSAVGGLLSSASSIASAATLINHHEISAATGVNGIILSNLTSILVNVFLIRSMTKDATFRRKICLGLAMVALFGFVGTGLN